MSIETYRLEVRESANGAGIDADVYGEDGVVESSTRVSYADFGLEPAGEGEGESESEREEPAETVREVTADITTIDVQIERDGSGFTFRVLGDRDDLLTEHLADERLGVE